MEKEFIGKDVVILVAFTGPVSINYYGSLISTDDNYFKLQLFDDERLEKIKNKRSFYAYDGTILLKKDYVISIKEIGEQQKRSK